MQEVFEEAHASTVQTEEFSRGKLSISLCYYYTVFRTFNLQVASLPQCSTLYNEPFQSKPPKLSSSNPLPPLNSSPQSFPKSATPLPSTASTSSE